MASQGKMQPQPQTSNLDMAFLIESTNNPYF